MSRGFSTAVATALAQQHVHVGLVRVLAHGVAEEDDRIQEAFGDECRNLGITSEGP